MFGRRGFIGMVGAILGFEASKMAAADAPEAKPNEDIDQLRAQLAGCGVAATGWNHNPASPGMWGWSPSYQDVLDLRRKFEAAMRVIGDRSPAGLVIALYPCGCSATGDEGIPGYCPTHGDAEHTDRCHVVPGMAALNRA